MRQQKRKRWCRHLQRWCGTKQFWEVLAFSGRFDVQFLRSTRHSQPGDREYVDPFVADGVQKDVHLELYYKKEAAKALFREGHRLAEQQKRLRELGASQPAKDGVEAGTLSKRQKQVLQNWENGKLLDDANTAVAAFGHGRLRRSDSAKFMDIGGSTGGSSRRVLDGPQSLSDSLDRFYALE